jgi:hypothetical protein
MTFVRHPALILGLMVVAIPAHSQQLAAPDVRAQTFTDSSGNKTTMTFQLPNLGNPDNLLTFENNSSNGNTIAVRNTNNGGFSAIVFRDMFGNENGAIYSDNNLEGVVTASITGDQMIVSAIAPGGTVQVGATAVGIGTPTAVGTFVVSPNAGTTDGVGTYTLSVAQPSPIASETIDLMMGGINWESSGLFAPGNPNTVPAAIDFRQSFQPGPGPGGVEVHFMGVDQNSNVHMVEFGPCNASGQEQDTVTMDRAGFMGVCAGSQPAAGVSFGVGWGGSFFSRTNVGGDVAANADVTVANATQPDLKFNIPGGDGWTADIRLNSSPFRLDVVDTQGGGDIPFSMALDGTKTVTAGGPTKYTGAVRSVPTTAGTVTFATTQRLAIIDPAGTLATLTVELPACAAANDGDERWWLTTQALTILTISASSGSVANGAATSALAGGGRAYHCLGSNATWYQMN